MQRPDVNRSSFDQYMLPNYAPMNLVAQRGSGSRLWDQDDREYMDLSGGIAVNAFGHCHPELVATLRAQADTLWHVSNVFTNEPALQLAQQLVELTFAERVFFANSGAEANEAALKLARRRGWHRVGPEKHRIVAARGAFHGRTLFTVTAGGQAKYTQGFEPAPEGFSHVPYNDLDALRASMDDSVCALLLEPIQGESGVHPASREYLAAARALCDEHDALLIFDEVQTGVSRTGDLYAYMGYGVVPDLLTTAKALGGGFPISALLATEDSAPFLPTGTHGSTYGGNPLGCQVARKALEIATRPELQDNVRQRSAQLHQHLVALDQKFQCFTEIRGKGLLLGAQLNEPWAPHLRDCLQAAVEQGVMVLSAGADTLRFAPALVITEAELETAMARLERALAQVAANL